MKPKVCVVITARASYARVKTVLEALKGDNQVDLRVLAVGEVLQAGYEDSLLTSCEITGALVQDIGENLHAMAPAMVVTIADRYETLATAVAAAYQNIPLAHLQGGELTGNIDQKVRYAVTALADYHFAATRRAFDRVLKCRLAMGDLHHHVYQTGCPSIDVAANLQGGQYDVSREEYIVILQHPVTTEMVDMETQIKETLKAVAMVGIDAIFVGPNPDPGSARLCSYLTVIQPDRPPEDFMALVKGSRCLVGNSSMGIRECSFLGTPAVNIGSRQDGRERAGNAIDVGHNATHIGDAIMEQVEHGAYPSSNLYGDGQAGKRIAKIIQEVL